MSAALSDASYIPDTVVLDWPTLVDAMAGDRAAFDALPVGMKVALVQVARTAANQPGSIAQTCETAGVSRTTFARKNGPWRTLAEAIRDQPTGLIDAVGVEPVNAEGVGSHGAGQIAKRDIIIAELRRELNNLKSAVKPVMAYAHDLAVELRKHRDTEQEERDRKVHHLRPVATPTDDA